MALSKLSKADLKTIMELNEMTAHLAWNHGHKAGDEGAPQHLNPFAANREVSEKLLTLLNKALEN